MARRERERYTERNRPHRKDAGRAGGGEESAWNNPIVIVAAVALLLAVVLAVGFLVGRTGTQTAGTTGTPGAETGAISQTVAAAEVSTVAPQATVSGTEATAIPAGTLWLPDSGTPFKQPDDMKLDGATTAYFATIETVSGTIRAEVWPELAPATVNSFVFLADKDFYNGLTFHRVEDWVVQGGDPLGNGTGGPGYLLPAEFHAEDPVPQRYGTVAMARSSDPNSAGSQFYIVKDPAGASFLDGQYTVFGQVIEGMDVVSKLVVGTVMTSVTIEEKPKSESVVSPDDVRANKLPEPPPAETP
jgi:peptidylprolyl isomerase